MLALTCLRLNPNNAPKGETDMYTPKILLPAVAALTLCAVLPAAAQTLPLPLPPAAGVQRTGPHRGGERHPELRRALRTLERTEADLRRANRDFGGHRTKAANLCRQAESEIQLALQSDRG